MRDLVFLKLGGSILTDKTRAETLNEPVLAELARAIVAALDAPSAPRLLLGHGAGSFGHHWAQRYQTHLGVKDVTGWQGVARVADSMGRLNRGVVRSLLDAGVDAVSVQPSASAIAAGGKLTRMSSDALATFLRSGMVPVLYGDVVVDTEQGAAIVSTEDIFAFLAPVLRPRRIVLVGEAGVYTADPRRDPAAARIPLIDESNIAQARARASGSHGVDVTGGMASKLATMWELVSMLDGLEVVLVGPQPALLLEALAGTPDIAGTTIRRTRGRG